MLSLVAKLHSRFCALGRDESGQDAFEYLLVIAVVMLAIVGAAKTDLAPSVVTTIVTSITDQIDDLLP